jgi:N-terminal half of MaoC dehydratase
MATSILDTSDIDQYLGKAITSSRIREPIANNDIRRWAQAMHYPNLLHYDPTFAEESRYGKLVAMQSFPCATDDGMGTAPACVGCIPNSHLLFGGEEWWFEDRRVAGGDWVYNERIPFDYVVKETKLAGPTCFQRGDNYYTNQHGQLLAKQRSTAIRYNAAAGGEGVNSAEFDEPEWSDDAIEATEERKLGWIKMLRDLGHGKRWWDDVKVGDQLPERVFGPHSVSSFMTEWRGWIINTWGAVSMRKLDLAALGFTPEMAGYENDPDMHLLNPELTDGAYFGPSRGHQFPKYARRIGMPRAYGYGGAMGAWVIDYMSGWAGEHGMVAHSVANFRGPALSGDVTVQTAEVVDKTIDDKGRHLVHVKHLMATHKGTTMAAGTAEIALPKKAG